MLALPDPASNVTSDVVFTSKKSACVVFPLTIVLRNTVIVRLAVCTSIVFMFFHVWLYVLPLFPCFSMFSSCFSHFSHQPNVVEFSVFTTKFSPQGVHLELEGWPWKGEGALGAKGMWGSHSVWVSPTRAR